MASRLKVFSSSCSDELQGMVNDFVTSLDKERSEYVISLFPGIGGFCASIVYSVRQCRQPQRKTCFTDCDNCVGSISYDAETYRVKWCAFHGKHVRMGKECCEHMKGAEA